MDRKIVSHKEQTLQESIYAHSPVSVHRSANYITSIIYLKCFARINIEFLVSMSQCYPLPFY